MKTIFILFLNLTFSTFITAQHHKEPWKLIENSDKIKIYSRLPEDSKYKEIKMELFVAADPLKILDFISSPDRFPEWIYTCSESYKVYHSDFTDAYYMRFDMRWPIYDRDLVQASETIIDHATGIITIHTSAVKDLVPTTRNVVRIAENDIYWKLTPVGKKKTYIEYHVINNPGGSVPAWLMNMVASIGPKQSMQKMMEIVEK